MSSQSNKEKKDVEEEVIYYSSQTSMLIENLEGEGFDEPNNLVETVKVPVNSSIKVSVNSAVKLPTFCWGLDC